jgi:hypothetical protein
VTLFVVSLLAPVIWQEVRLTRWTGAAPSAVEIVEPRVVESFPCPPRLSAYVPPGLARDDGLVAAAALVPDTFAGRFGQLYRPADPTVGDAAIDDAGDVADVQPPADAEVYVGQTHGEPADAATLRIAPAALLSQLDALAQQPRCQAWAAGAARRIHAYLDARSEDAVKAALKDLEDHLQALDKLLTQAEGEPVAASLRRTRHALERRVDVWKAIQAMNGRKHPTSAYGPQGDAAAARKDLSAKLAAAEQFLADAETGALWAKFLLLKELREAAGSAKTENIDKVIAQVRRVLARYGQPGMTVRQRLYLRQQPLWNLKSTLLRMTDEPVDVGRALAAVEAYEVNGLPTEGEEVAAAIGRLMRSHQPEERELGRRLNWHYRGTNLRLAVSEEMLTRFLPKQDEPSFQPVFDTILGVPVSGQSLTRNDLRVRLLRSQGDVARLELQARGTVESQTSARSGPVSTYNRTDAEYLVSKTIDIEPDGLRSSPAQVQHVRSNSQLQGLRTDWDGLPLIGDLVRSMANSQYQSTEAQRQQEVEGKLRQRAEAQFEQQSAPLLANLNRSFTNRVLVPLGRLDLQPEAVVERPADERMNVRFRLANDDQLSGHTPRPRALAGSLASAQVHESFLNNVLEQLRLDGRTMNAKELVDHINRKLNTKLAHPADSDDAAGSRKQPVAARNLENASRLSFTFADRNALRARLADDRLWLIVTVARLEAGGRRWSNFQILVPYGFQPQGATVQLAQADEISLKGRLSNRSQIIIRGILTNFFDSDAKYDLLANLFDTRRLGEVHVAQIVITDGWLGLSMMKK